MISFGVSVVGSVVSVVGSVGSVGSVVGSVVSCSIFFTCSCA